MTNNAGATLSDKQLALLQNLLQKRVRIFAAGTLACSAIWLRLAYPIIRNWHFLQYKLPYGAVEYKTYEKVNNYFMSAVALFLLLLCFFSISFYKKIHLLMKDIRHKVVVVVAVQITRKTSPYTNRYFFYLNNLKPSYIEVDDNTYYQYQEGETINIYRAKFSKIHLDEYLNIPLL